MSAPTRPSDGSATPAPARYGVAERLMLADVSGGLFGDGHELVAKIGRFVLLEELGAGGMGRVFRAYDPELDRSLALKVLRREVGDVESATMRLRVEAVALARLNHPNVVAIHEVQQLGDELILAMELVDGTDLGRWAKQHAPKQPFVEDDRFRTAIGYLRQAATGLAAAHAAGLVHRDFKPSNVLVGDDGRVRVADFGLAKAAADREPAAPRPSAAMLASPLTSTGRVPGTPRYMALEQSEGRRVDPRTDQFAFCVTAWEVLFGRHPWGGSVPTRKAPSAPDGVPVALARTLVQGLAADPSERHASMDALLAALPSERARPSNVRGVVFAAGVAAVLTALGIIAFSGDDACAGAREALADVWDPAQKERLREAVLGSEVPYAGSTWDHLESTLDAYAERWVETHTEACEATQVRREQTSEMMDAKMACLAQRRRALAAFVRVVAEGTPGAIEDATLGAIELPRVESCAEDDFVREGFEAPAGAQAQEVDAIRDVLAESEALRRAGEYERARDLLREVEPRVEALGFEPVEMEFAFERAAVASDLEEWEIEGEQLLVAYMGAARAGRASLAAEAASLLAVTVAYSGESAEADRWTKVAESALPDAPEPGLAARLADDLGDVAIIGGDNEAAAAAYRKALAMRASEVGPDDPRIIGFLLDLGQAFVELGEYDEADATFDRALALSRTLGDGHPRTGAVLSQQARLAMARSDNATLEALAPKVLEIARATFRPPHPDIANALSLQGDTAVALGRTTEALRWLAEADAMYAGMDHPAQRQERAFAKADYSDALATAGRIDEAAARSEEALALLRAAFPPGHREVAAAVYNLGVVRRQQGRTVESLALHEEARDLTVQRLGPRHPDLVAMIGGTAAVLIDLQRYPEAIATIQHQLDLVDEVFGEDSVQRAQPLYNLALCKESLGLLAEAEPLYAESLAILEAHTVPGDPSRAYPLIGLAKVLLAADRPEAALERAEAALELLKDGDAKLRADAQAAVAMASWTSGRDRARARTLADEAAAAYRDLGKEADAQRERLEAFRNAKGL